MSVRVRVRVRVRVCVCVCVCVCVSKHVNHAFIQLCVMHSAVYIFEHALQDLAFAVNSKYHTYHRLSEQSEQVRQSARAQTQCRNWCI